jgi:hypothetical protein
MGIFYQLGGESTFMEVEMNFSRRQLYDLVWSKPVVSLAMEYGFSNVGFAKICRRNSIPLPPRGYWAKINAGLQVVRPPLPNLHWEGLVYIPPKVSITDEAILEKKKILAQEKSELEQIGVISIPAQITTPHKVTHNTQRYFEIIIKKIEQSKKSNSLPRDYYSLIQSIYRGRIQCKQDNCFDVAVTEQLLERALNLLDVLVKELERNGFRIHPAKDKKSKGAVVALKENEVISFSVSEGYKYQAIEDPKSMTELERLLYSEKIPVATGKLTFSVYASETHIGKNWTDGKRLIESELPAIIHEFINLVPKQKQARIDALARQELRNEEARLFRERERQRYLEQSIYDEALRESQIFKAHKELEAYLNYLEVQYLEQYGVFNEQVLAWFSTARKIENEKNPVIRRLRILGNNQPTF